jgi:hypothetical protein
MGKRVWGRRQWRRRNLGEGECVRRGESVCVGVGGGECGIGECGLDYNKNFSPHYQQLEYRLSNNRCVGGEIRRGRSGNGRQRVKEGKVERELGNQGE